MDEAQARKERLRALKEAAQLTQTDSGQEPAAAQENQEHEPAKPVLKFRNYVVKDDRIEHEKELIVSMAPKKANWDLKRDIQPILDKLERRTQKAMIELMQEEEKRRLQESMEQE